MPYFLIVTLKVIMLSVVNLNVVAPISLSWRWLSAAYLCTMFLGFTHSPISIDTNIYTFVLKPHSLCRVGNLVGLRSLIRSKLKRTSLLRVSAGKTLRDESV